MSETAASPTALAAEKTLSADESEAARMIASGLREGGDDDTGEGGGSDRRPPRESTRAKPVRGDDGGFRSPREAGYERIDYSGFPIKHGDRLVPEGEDR